MSKVFNSLVLDKMCLEVARRQFCLDIGLPWDEYERNREKSVLIQPSLPALPEFKQDQKYRKTSRCGWSFCL